MKVLVTGCAGFIGYFTAARLLARGDTVIGLDNLNDYYDVGLKRARLDLLSPFASFQFRQTELTDADAIATLFASEPLDRVVHLAAQAGVRNSIRNPMAYVQSNIVGFTNILEGCRTAAVSHLVYASSSSVYGGNQKLPYRETDAVDHPVSPYAATKKANELMAHAYSHLHGLATTGLRFFTVYGPWGRPDMSPILFARAIMEGTPIEVFNHGDMARDFTYIDDIVEGIVRILDRPAVPDPQFDPMHPSAASGSAPYRIYNIGNEQTVSLLDYIQTLEAVLGKRTEKRMLPMQEGDVQRTWADTTLLRQAIGVVPSTPLKVGLESFASWFTSYYHY